MSALLLAAKVLGYASALLLVVACYLCWFTDLCDGVGERRKWHDT